jgi:hypothetical protein
MTLKIDLFVEEATRRLSAETSQIAITRRELNSRNTSALKEALIQFTGLS